MVGSSPAQRRSHQWSSPDRRRLSSLLSENRNSELSHQEALAAAQAEHDRVREAALRAYQLHEQKEEQKRWEIENKRVQEQLKLEEARIRQEEKKRADEEKLRSLKAKVVPQLPPEPPAPAPSLPNDSASASKQSEPKEPEKSAAAPAKPSLFNPPAGQPNGVTANTTTQAPPNPFLGQQSSAPTKPAAVPPAQTSISSPFTKVGLPQQQQQQSPGLFGSSALATTTGQQQANTGSALEHDRYTEIHQNLKKLRASIKQQAQSNPTLKSRMGDMRREIKKCIGQLVGEKGGNKKQQASITAILSSSLDGSVPSIPVDPNDFITDKNRQPVEGAQRNEAQLPSLFLWLLNHFSKAVINQYINECGAQPKTADPIGVIAALVFSHKLFQWRGKTLIDILMAKFRVVCPVLFGYRGDERTDQGKLRLGWKRGEHGQFEEQKHIFRMNGLAAGYASIGLRDFSRSPNTNPWPPSKYWQAMARIVNTPSAEISNTQGVVLRSMIEHYEDRFLGFYGSAAVAALRKALMDFPNKAINKTPGLVQLTVFVDILRRDKGIDL